MNSDNKQQQEVQASHSNSNPTQDVNSSDVYERILNKNILLQKRALRGGYQVLANLACLGVIIFLYMDSMSFQIPPQLIPVNKTGSYFESAPLTSPLHNQKELKQWYIDTVSELFEYHYRNIDEHSSNVSRHFAQRGLADFDEFITSSKFATKVRRNYGIVEPVIDDKVKVQSGQVKGRLGWQMETKIALMIYINGKPMRAGVYEIRSVVKRENENLAEEGIVIQTINLKEVTR